MSLSQTDICNATLIKLGQDIAIASIAEQSKPARIFARIWDRVVALVLSEHAWPFALKSAALAVDPQDPYPGWGYRYTYPDDAVTMLALSSEAGIRGGVAAFSGCCRDSWGAVAFSGRLGFDVMHGDQSATIAADAEGAYGLYIARVDDTARWPVLFAEAVACRLAFEAAPAIQGELGIRAQGALEQRYELARAKAVAHAFNESLDPVLPLTPSLAARL